MKKLESAYIGYYDQNGSKNGFKIKTFKKINAANSYTIDYVHNISKAFNFLLGRVAFFSERFNKEVAEVILTGKDLANNIGCSVSHASSYIIPELKELFNLDFDRNGNAHGARTIRINKRIIDFLKIYSEEEFQAYLMLNNLMDKERILRRLFERRIWEVTDSQLSKEQIQAKQAFLNQNDIRNYHYYTYTNNKSNRVRIEYIEKALQYLSQIERDQLSKIKEAATSENKLEWYLHKVLIKLEQRVKYLLTFVHKKEQKVTTSSQPTNQNLNQEESVAHKSATAASQKIPEDPSGNLTYREVVQFFMIWNHMAPDQHLNMIKEITLNRILLIGNLVKSHNKGDLFQALNNIKKLYHEPEYKYKVSFRQFATSRFMNILEATEADTRLDSEYSWSDGVNHFMATKRIKASVPEFTSIQEANTWFKANNA